MKQYFLACISSVLLTACSASNCPQGNPQITLMVKNKSLLAEVAQTQQSRVCGLSKRNNMPYNHAMLFVYPVNKVLKFWMKDTFIPLSIAFLDSDGVILKIAKMNTLHKNEKATLIFHQAARYALEVNQGWFNENAIVVGDRVIFSLKEL